MDIRELLHVVIMNIWLLWLSMLSARTDASLDQPPDSCQNGSLQILTGLRGTITVRTADQRLRSTCRFLIIAPKGHFIQLQDIAFQTSSQEGCDEEYVALYDGRNESSPVIARFCSDQEQDPPSMGFASRGLYVYVEISVAETTIAPFYFTTRYTVISKPPPVPFAVCTDYNRVRQPMEYRGGLITSHDQYPNPLGDRNVTSCQLDIKSDDPADRIYINILSIVKYPNSESSDCLQIMERNGHILGTFCDQTVGRVISTTPSVRLLFVNRNNTRRETSSFGFLASFTVFYIAKKDDMGKLKCEKRHREFACGNEWCIPTWMLCDKTYHCLDGSDEVACNGLSDSTYVAIFSGMGLAALSVWSVAMILMMLRARAKKKHFHQSQGPRSMAQSHAQKRNMPCNKIF